MQCFQEFVWLLQNACCVLTVAALHEFTSPRCHSLRRHCLVLVLRLLYFFRHPGLSATALSWPLGLVPLSGLVRDWCVGRLTLFEIYFFYLVAQRSDDPQSLLTLRVGSVLVQVDGSVALHVNLWWLVLNSNRALGPLLLLQLLVLQQNRHGFLHVGLRL